MVRLGTPIDIENYIKVNYEVGSLIQQNSIFPIWRDSEFMYFEIREELIDYIGKEKLTDEGID